MSLKGKILYGIFFLCFFAVCCILIFFWLLLPSFLNSDTCIQNLQKDLPFDVSWNIRRLGLTGADIGSLQIGPDDKKTLFVNSLTIDYSPARIFHKHINKISFNGIKLYCGFKNGQFYFRGFDLKTFLKQINSSRPPSVSTQFSLPVSFGKVEIQNAVIVFNWNQRSFRIPLKLELYLKNSNILNGNIRIYLRNQEIDLVFNLDLLNKKIDLNLKGKSIIIERFADITGIVKGFYLTGEMDITGISKIQLDPFAVISARSSLSFRNKDSLYAQINVQLKEIPDALECSGDLQIEAGKYSVKSTPSFEIVEPIILKEYFSARLFKNGKWDFELKSIDRDVNHLVPSVVKLDKAAIIANPLKIEFKASGQAGMEKALFKLETNNAELKSGDIKAKIPDLSVSGKIVNTEEGRLNCNGELKVGISDIRDSKSKVSIKGLDASFPFQWPWKKNLKKGRLSVLSIKRDKMNIGSFKGFLQQDKKGIKFGGKHGNKIIPGLKVDIKGISNFLNKEKNAQVNFKSVYKRTKPMNLGLVNKAAEGIEFDGLLTLNGELNFDESGLKSGLNTILDNANIRIKENNAVFKKVYLNFSMPDLFNMQSNPQQKLSIGNISIGNINISDALFEFQMESDRSVLIEKSSFKWCNGNVNSQSLRIIPGIHDYNLILYCDRLNLAELFMQLGVARAEGKGTVSGRIPVQFKKGDLNFYDGFLFSTPGDGGTIHLSGSEILTRGIPENTAQYNQIDLAREALKDYDYNWVKLLMNTEGENLMLKITFDGRPSNLLPFIYDKDFGGFVRVKSGKQLSDFQGIRLNVNMGIPLNKILKHKGILDTFNNN